MKTETLSPKALQDAMAQARVERSLALYQMVASLKSLFGRRAPQVEACPA